MPRYNATAPTDSSGIPFNGVYDSVTGNIYALQAGTVSTDTNHNSQGYAPAAVALLTPTATSGHVIIDANTIASYAASITGLAPAATPTDVFTITGSASKVIRIMRVAVSASTTSAVAATNDVQFIVRSTANSGGTSSAATAVPFDSNDAAATATVLSYTVNPASLGTAVGTVYAGKITPTLNPYTSTDFPSQAPVVVQYGITDSKPIVLRGITQVFAVNFNATTLTATASVDIVIEWTEALT